MNAYHGITNGISVTTNDGENMSNRWSPRDIIRSFQIRFISDRRSIMLSSTINDQKTRCPEFVLHLMRFIESKNKMICAFIEYIFGEAKHQHKFNSFAQKLNTSPRLGQFFTCRIHLIISIPQYNENWMQRLSSHHRCTVCGARKHCFRMACLLKIRKKKKKKKQYDKR